jgi:endonuclease III
MKTLVHEKGLSIKMVQEITEKELNVLISAVGFHNKKAKYIKEVADIIATKYKG